VTKPSPIRLTCVFVAVLAAIAPACGKRGGPLPPLRPAPERATNVSILRRGADVTMRFSFPTRNLDGSEPVLLDRLEIYAVTVPAGGIRPTDPELVKPEFRIATIQNPRKPSGAPGATGASGASGASGKPTTDEPPAPIVFTDKVAMPGPGAVDPTQALAQERAKKRKDKSTPIIVPSAIRCYLIASFANRTRPGAWTEMYFVPLTETPPAPRAAAITYDESQLTLKWTPGTAAPGQRFRVYEPAPTAPTTPTTPATAPAAAPSMPVPVNPTLLTTTTHAEPVTFGTPRCLMVRAVSIVGSVAVESEPSNVACETPKDTFPPPAPANLVAFASESGVSLTWDAVTAPDLEGYLVLRGEGANATLQPLSTTPIAGTQFNDTTTRAGVRYVYAVVAVDKAANRSKESNRQETGR
jgi:hypothetical protein